MFGSLDRQQLARIESVHRGFLYQHLYAVGCLLLAGKRGVRSVTVELDEDVEIELENGDRLYLQIKTRSTPLVLSDIAGALARFGRLRLEHQEGRRPGVPSFAIIANVAPGPELHARADGVGLPEGALLLTPGATMHMPACLPPPWCTVSDAIAWCTDHARELPMTTLEPDTLMWKLAGRVLLASAGQAPGHSFDTASLPTLFEQLIVQLQQFPAPPEIYRPLEDEPSLDSEARVHIVSGFSGAGKTAWAAQAAVHMGSECAYYDVGEIPGPAIAASLVRELAAQWAAPTVGGLRQVLLPGATGVEALRALDRFLGANNARAIVVLDNAHRVPANDLRMLIEATRYLRFVLLAQPSPSIAELEATIGLQQDLLHGWGLDQTAAETHAQGVRASGRDIGRLLALTGGLPLYVRTAAQLSASQYGGDVAAMCAAVEARSHLVETAQELILRRSFDALPEFVRDCVAVLSLSDVPLSEHEAARLVKAALGLDTPTLAAAVRQLRPLGVVRIHRGQQLQIHDSFRVLGRHRFSGFPPSQATGGREALKDVILDSFKKRQDTSRFPLLIRTLVELDELKPLVDIATEEWFHELGVDSGIWDALKVAYANEAIDPEQRFYALDGLVFARMKAGEREKIGPQLEAMDALVAEHGLGDHEKLVVLLKRLMFEAAQGNEIFVRQAMTRAPALVPDRPDHQRILSYSIAHALFTLGHHAEAEAIARELVEAYYDVLGLTPEGIVGLSNRKIAEKLKPSPSLQDDMKHLADSLDIVARATNAQGRDAVLARVHAAKFYDLANAVDSFVNINQDLVDEFVGREDYVGARQVIEDHLLPAVINYRMLDKLVSVRSQYAVVLGYCGDFDAADAEFARLAAYEPGLTANQHREIENQRELIVKLRHLGRQPSNVLDQSLAPLWGKVGRNEPCPCGSGFKYKKCHGST